MTSQSPLELDVNGTPPGLAGKQCEGMLVQQYFYRGALEDDANNIYLRFEDTWHRLYFDCGTVFWRIQDSPPEPFVVADEGWEYPLLEIGVSAGVVGVRLDTYDMAPLEAGAFVEFKFANGKRIRFRNVNDRTSYVVI